MVYFCTPLLLDIPYDAADATHKIVGIITSSLAYVASYYASFPRPTRPQSYDPRIRDNTTEVYLTHTQWEWTSKKEYFDLFEATERGVMTSITTIVGKTWNKELERVEL